MNVILLLFFCNEMVVVWGENISFINVLVYLWDIIGVLERMCLKNMCWFVLSICI